MPPETEAELRTDGHELLPSARALLEEFGGLTVVHPHFRVAGSLDSFVIDPLLAARGRDPAWVHDYERRAEERADTDRRGITRLPDHMHGRGRCRVRRLRRRSAQARGIRRRHDRSAMTGREASRIELPPAASSPQGGLRACITPNSAWPSGGAFRSATAYLTAAPRAFSQDGPRHWL
jgi:hypothetical protein